MDDKMRENLELSYEFDAKKVPMKDVFDLSGKVAIVTGGCTGLGFAVTSRLVEAGAKVVIASRSAERGAKAEAYFRDKGYDVTYCQVDVRDVDQCYAMVEFTEKTYQQVDILVPCAAYWDMYAFVDTQEQVYKDIMDTNVKGQYYCIQAAARSMIKRGKGGKICMISSIMRTGVGDTPHMNLDSVYITSKSALTGMCVALARELRVHGISVNCVAPGAMTTWGMRVNGKAAYGLYGDEYMPDVMKYGPEVPRSETPDDVARMVLCMCTSVSDFMRGVTVDVDGGATMTFTEKPWSITLEGCVPGPAKK